MSKFQGSCLQELLLEGRLWAEDLDYWPPSTTRRLTAEPSKACQREDPEYIELLPVNFFLMEPYGNLETVILLMLVSMFTRYSFSLYVPWTVLSGPVL